MCCKVGYMLPQSRRSASATGHFAASAAAEVGYHMHRGE